MVQAVDPTPGRDPEDPAGLHLLGVAAFERGDFEAGLGFVAKACAFSDVPGFYHRNHAELLWRCGQLAAAEMAARTAIMLDPSNALSWETLGGILFRHGAFPECCDCFATAIQIDPNNVQALNNLAVVLQRLGRRRQAEECYRQVLGHAPNPETLLNLAVLLSELGHYADARAMVAQVLEQQPQSVRALLIASEIEWSCNRRLDALTRAEQALVLAPDHNVRVYRGRVLGRFGRHAEALGDFDAVLSEVPDDPGALHGKALALQGLNQPAAAFEAFRQAEAASVEPAAIIADRAWLLAEMGRKAEALTVAGEALTLQPDLATAWYYRAYLSDFTPGHPDLAAMARIAGNPDTPYWDRAQISFALGKAYLDIGDGAPAFAWLDEANRLKRAMLTYDPEAEQRRFESIMAAFSPELLCSSSGSRATSVQPVFVFGMPRSGTTLVEHILASHPFVHGAGEPTCLQDLATESGFPDGVLRFDREGLAALGTRYVEAVGAGAGGRRWLVDKMPSNFIYAGFAALILPGAKMIHCRRDPLDTCLSCYSLLFANLQEYSYDQWELGRFYRLYLDLMDHWRRVLPPENFLEIDYEALVDDAEATVKTILDFCGLPWDPACLRFHETSRRVTSASLAQVRSPIYSKSIGRAQQFREWLGPLMAALDGDPIPQLPSS